MRRVLFCIAALLALVALMAACADKASDDGLQEGPQLDATAPAASPTPAAPPPQQTSPTPPPEGGGQNTGETPGGAPDHEEPPQYDATIEYGIPDSIKVNEGPLYTYIRFPQAGHETDAAIAEWAFNVHESAWKDFEEVLKSDSSAIGEINVNFDSWLVDDRFAGILEKGSFMHSLLAHPLDITYAFNIDLSSGAFLDNSDIIDTAQHEKVLLLLRDAIIGHIPDAEGLLGDIDGSWLSRLVICHEGITVVLERNAFLPGSFGTVEVTIPYGDLGSALVLGASIPPVNAPENPESPESPDAPVAPTPKPPPPPPRPIPVVPPQSDDIDPLLPMVALTFDDGPSRYTSDILDLLEQYGARATFFTVGNLVNAYSEAVERANSIGCEVAGHSWSHKNLTRATEDEVVSQILDTSLVIEEITGAALPFFRPPYGSVDDELRRITGELGFAMINWSVDPRDWSTRDEDLIFDAIMDKVKDGSIIICHDIYSTTADAMVRVIPELIFEGYQLVTVSQLLYLKYGSLEAGRVYNR